MPSRALLVALSAGIPLAALFAPVAAFNELRGTELRACVIEEPPYVVADPSRRSGYSGLAITYLEAMRDHLQFQVELIPWNKTWSDFITHFERCNPQMLPTHPDACSCTLGVGAFTVTNDRAERVNFVWPFSNEGHQMVSRRSDLVADESESRWFVFKTFTPQVWVLIIGCLLLHTFGSFFFVASSQPSVTHSHTERSPSSSYPLFHTSCITLVFRQLQRFPATLLSSYSHLLGQPLHNDQIGTPSFHRSAWFVLGSTTGIFLLTLYQASLTVLLFESKKVSPFRRLDDIYDCNIDVSRVAMIRGGASQDFWEKCVNISRLRKRCNWHKVGVPVESSEEAFRALTDGSVDYFYSLRGSMLYHASVKCEGLVTVGEPFFSTSVAFALPRNKNATIHELLDSTTRILREGDRFPTADLVASRNSCADGIDATITSEKLLAFSIMYAAAWVFLIVYRIIFLWKRRRKLRAEEEKRGLGQAPRSFSSNAVPSAFDPIASAG